jgi:MFS family permease
MSNGATTERTGLVSVSPLFVGLALLMVGSGLLGSLLGIRASIEGFPTVVIGIVMAMHYAGFLVGSLTIPKWLATVGHIRVFAGLAALAAAAAMSYPLLVTPIVWGLFRFIAGFSMSGLYVTVESWLNDRASNDTRGRLLAVYMIVVTVGISLGQILLGASDPAEPTLFVWVGVLITLSIVPIALIPISTPSRPIPVSFSLRALGQSAPLGIVAIALAGAAGSSVLGLGAVYATDIGMTPSRAGVFMAFSLLGAVVTQYPIGWLSDRFPRRTVILAVAAGAVGVSGIAITLNSESVGLFVLMSIYGSLTFPMYSLGVSAINDLIEDDQLVVVAAGIVFVYGIGSVSGPLVVSVLMAVVGPAGYHWGLGAFFLPVAVYALVRGISQVRPIQRRFVNLPARSSTAAALLAQSSGEGEQAETDE